MGNPSLFVFYGLGFVVGNPKKNMYLVLIYSSWLIVLKA